MKIRIKIMITGLLFGLMIGLGSMASAQNNQITISDPINVAVPYLNYNGIADKDEAMRTWIKANPVACQAYVTQVTTKVKGLNMPSLTPQENYYVKKRMYECNKIAKLAANN